MPRARNIKPGFFKNEDLVELPYEWRLLFAGLWVLSDRAGRLEDRPKRIKMEIFPADNVDVDAGLDDLQQSGFILRYQVGNRRYIQVLNFERHQNPHKNEAPSSIPAPEQHGASTVQEPDQHGTARACSLIPCSLIPEDKTLGPSDDAPSEPKRPKKQGYPPEFEAAWQDYPGRAGGNSKADAFRAWKARVREGKATEDLHAGTKRYAAFVREGGKEGTSFVKQAATFFGPGLHFEEPWAEQQELTAIDIEMIQDPEKRSAALTRYMAQQRAKPQPEWMRGAY